jgi:hypothetical protein
MPAQALANALEVDFQIDAVPLANPSEEQEVNKANDVAG